MYDLGKDKKLDKYVKGEIIIFNFIISNNKFNIIFTKRKSIFGEEHIFRLINFSKIF